ncbi:macro domain-containing protein [Riemerella anatipestifer]|nr:macro domain-containing protein [Riemerella anatipestifer]MDY3534284.1 macro domain-containing protein [Riemerella anatipestifer]
MKIITGNIFRTEMQTIVNTVNCFGIMGAGLALECKYRYPDMFVRYKEMCDKKLLDIGKLYLYKTHQKWILNFPTKYHWKYETKPEYLEKGLAKFLETYKVKGINSIAFPLLGAHNGGLSKEQSLELIEKYLKDIDIPFEIYQFDPKAPDDLYENFKTAFLSTDTNTLKKVTGLKENKISQLIELLNSTEIKNMGQIASNKGIGEITLEKCFNYAMRSDILNIQLNLF